MLCFQRGEEGLYVIFCKIKKIGNLAQTENNRYFYVFGNRYAKIG